jgi:hypothetical protein
VFFYGSYINLNVLKEVDLIPEQWEVVRLAVLTFASHPEQILFAPTSILFTGLSQQQPIKNLKRLYVEYAHGKLGEVYLPEAVLVHTLDGKLKPTMTYICPAMEPRPAENAYVDSIVNPAKSFSFPEWYVRRLESFRS